MPSFPVLQAERLLLRQFQDEDIEMVFRAMSNPEVYRYYGVRYESLEATKEQMEFFRRLEEEGSGCWWAIVCPEHGDFYGGIGFNNYNRLHRRIEIGIWLLPEYWGRGFMQEALNKVCDFAFEQMKIHRIEATVESENYACKKALTKNGFNFEGRMSDYEFKDGRFIDLEMYARIHSDQAAQKSGQG